MLCLWSTLQANWFYLRHPTQHESPNKWNNTTVQLLRVPLYVAENIQLPGQCINAYAETHVSPFINTSNGHLYWYEYINVKNKELLTFFGGQEYILAGADYKPQRQPAATEWETAEWGSTEPFDGLFHQIHRDSSNLLYHLYIYVILIWWAEFGMMIFGMILCFLASWLTNHQLSYSWHHSLLKPWFK